MALDAHRPSYSAAQKPSRSHYARWCSNSALMPCNRHLLRDFLSCKWNVIVYILHTSHILCRWMKKKLNIKFRKINVITHWCISLSTALCNFCSSIPCWEKEIHYKFVPKDALLSRWGTVIISSTNRVCPNKKDMQRFLDIKNIFQKGEQ